MAMKKSLSSGTRKKRGNPRKEDNPLPRKVNPRRTVHAQTVRTGNDVSTVPKPQVPPRRATHIISINASHKREVKELRELYNKTRISNEKLEKKVSELTVDLKSLRTRYNLQLKKLETSEKLQTSLRCSLEDQKRKLKDKTRHLGKLEARIAHGGGEGRFLTERVDELQKMVKSLKAESHTFRERSEDAEAKLERQATEMSIMQRTLVSMSKGVDAQNYLSVANLLHTRARLEAENMHLSRTNARLSTEAKKFSETIENTRSSLHREVAKHKEVEAGKEEAEAQVQELKEENKTLVKYVEETMAKLEKVKKTLAEKELHIVRLQKQVLTGETDIDMRNRRLVEATSALEKSNAALTTVRKEHEEVYERLKQSEEKEAQTMEEMHELHIELNNFAEINQRLQQDCEAEKEFHEKLVAQGKQDAEEARVLRTKLASTIQSFHRLMEEKNLLFVKLREASARNKAQELIRQNLEEASRQQAQRIGRLLQQRQSKDKSLQQSHYSKLREEFSHIPMPESRSRRVPMSTSRHERRNEAKGNVRMSPIHPKNNIFDDSLPNASFTVAHIPKESLFFPLRNDHIRPGEGKQKPHEEDERHSSSTLNNQDGQYRAASGMMQWAMQGDVSPSPREGVGDQSKATSSLYPVAPQNPPRRHDRKATDNPEDPGSAPLVQTAFAKDKYPERTETPSISVGGGKTEGNVGEDEKRGTASNYSTLEQQATPIPSARVPAPTAAASIQPLQISGSVSPNATLLELASLEI